jgi:glycosyltransferase involved in cell wall biosynthesis
MGNHQPAISIITIVKDNKNLIGRAIQSVIKQKFTDIEYIIVNDGSTDGTQKIVDDFAREEHRIKVIHLNYNVGRAMARNKGLDTAIGRFVLFLDSDDYLPLNSLSELYSISIEHSADIVLGRSRCFDYKSGELKDEHYTSKIVNHIRHNFTLEEYPNLIHNHQIVGNLYSNSMIKNNNIHFSYQRKNGEDVLFAFYTVFHAKNISMVPHIISYYYSIGNYLGKANKDKLYDARDNVIETLDFVEKRGSETIKMEMRRKAALFASQLQRAHKVFGRQEDEFKAYINTLRPLIKKLPLETLYLLPPYEMKFYHALRSGKIINAYKLWIDNVKKNNSGKYGNNDNSHISTNTTELKPYDNVCLYHSNELNRLRSDNKKLSHQLNELYKSTSWRITRPIRILSKILRRNGIGFFGF